MKLKHLIVLPAVCVLGAAFVAPRGALGFHVEPKTKLTKTFESKLVLDIEEFSMSVDGNEMPMGDHAPKIHVEETEKVEVTDTYVAVGDGRVTKLERTFDEIGTESVQQVKSSAIAGGEEKETKKTKTCEIEGKSVVFTWNEKDEEYAAVWKEGEKGDEDLLEHLTGDMDLLGALPSKTVSDGDTWELDAEFFNRIFQPAGVLLLKTEGEEAADSDEESIAAELQFAKNRTGNARATYKGTREDDGVKVAVIEVTAQLSSTATVDRDKGTSELTIESDLTGEITWDLDHGHFRSVKLSGATKMKMDNRRSMEREGETHELVQSLTFKGEVELSLTAK